MNTVSEIQSAPTISPPPRESGLLQRKCACGQHTVAGGECDGCAKKRLQRSARSSGMPGWAPALVGEVLGTPGQPLDMATRAFMESRFSHDFSGVPAAPTTGLAASPLTIGSPGDVAEIEAERMESKVASDPHGRRHAFTPRERYDFSGVRVHTDARAAESAREVNALAYTVGSHIVFDAGRYSPATASGRPLLAHELTHVVQQNEGAVRSPVLRRSVGGFFSNIFQSIFGYDYSSSDLEEYLKKIDETGKIEDDWNSDNKAVQIVASWNNDEGKYVLTARRKAILILEMLDGYVGRDDQGAILDLLERSDTPTLEYIFGEGGVKHATLLSEFGSKRDQLYRFYQRRFPDAYKDPMALYTSDEEPAPAPPDLAKLNEVKPDGEKVKPDGHPIQTGDPLPETSRPQYDSVKSGDTKKRTEPVSMKEADEWVNEIYGSYIPDDKKPGPKGGYAEKNVKVSPTQPGESKVFEEFLYYCQRHGLSRDQCNYEEQNTMAFFDRENSEIVVRTDRETPPTRLHEVVHAYSHENSSKLARFAMEGLTEYFTRQIILRRKASGKHNDEKPLAIGQSYPGPYQAILELSLVVGEDFLAKVYFGGDVTSLCTKLGKATYDKWSAAMESRDGWQDAVKALREKPAPPAAGGKAEEKCS